MGKATNVKFGRYIQMVYANKSRLEIWEKMEHGRIRGLLKIFCVPPIISGTGKATNFELGRYIHTVHPNKSPLKFSVKIERGHIQGLPQFFEYPYYLRNG